MRPQAIIAAERPSGIRMSEHAKLYAVGVGSEPSSHGGPGMGSTEKRIPGSAGIPNA